MTLPGDGVLYPTPAECAALTLFVEPRHLGEALLDTAELQALDDPRAFLARHLRLGVLIPA